MPTPANKAALALKKQQEQQQQQELQQLQQQQHELQPPQLEQQQQAENAEEVIHVEVHQPNGAAPPPLPSLPPPPAAINQLPPPPGFNSINYQYAIPPMEKFKSGMSPTSWWTSFMTYVTILNLPALMIPSHFALYLEESGQAWFHSLENTVKSNLHLLKTAFIEKFSTITDYDIGLLQFKQNPAETVDQYFERIRKKTADVAVPNKMLMGMILSGLHSHLAKMVMPHQPSTLKEARELAIRCERTCERTDGQETNTYTNSIETSTNLIAHTVIDKLKHLLTPEINAAKTMKQDKHQEQQQQIMPHYNTAAQQPFQNQHPHYQPDHPQPTYQDQPRYNNQHNYNFSPRQPYNQHQQQPRYQQQQQSYNPQHSRYNQQSSRNNQRQPGPNQQQYNNNQRQSPRQFQCLPCGKLHNAGFDCQAKYESCQLCGRYGHIAYNCRKSHGYNTPAAQDLNRH